MSTKLPAQLPDWVHDHLALYEKDPEAAHMWDSSHLGGPGILPTLLLSTTGAKSGQTRTLPLIYGTHGDSAVIIASKGGAPSHPAWFLNLEADPNCTVQIASDRFAAKARVAEGEEREHLWMMMVGVYSPYEDYQNMTSRHIPVVVLDRA